MLDIRNDSKELLLHSEFLMDQGFKLDAVEDYSICLYLNNIKFDLFYERYEHMSDVHIQFITNNKSYSVGWILAIYCEENNIQCKLDRSNKLKNILAILEFIKENYNNVISQYYCETMMKKVEDFIIKKNKQ
jgi:hypothetical protein